MEIKGVHIFTRYNTESAEAKQLAEEIQAHSQKYRACKTAAEQAEHYITYKNLTEKLAKFQVGEKIVRNIVVTAGRSVLAQRLANTTTYTGVINYGALGTASTAPTNADTQLGTEVFRKTVASASFTTNNAFIDFFFTAADCNGTYNEFGTFIDGSGTANSGQMFTHALTGGWTKTSTETMTVSCQYTLS